MKVVDTDCCECGLPCLHEACKYYRVVRYICDRCEEEQDDLYYFGTSELCIDCIQELLERVEYDD